jgi:hypothetical protein
LGQKETKEARKENRNKGSKEAERKRGNKYINKENEKERMEGKWKR